MPESTQHKLDRIRPPRVQITYDVETRGSFVKKELPFVVGILADLSGNVNDPNRAPLRDRKYIEIDRDNFNDIMKSIGPKAEVEGGKIVSFQEINDFSPIKVLKQLDDVNASYVKRTRLSDAMTKLDGNVKLQHNFIQVLMDDSKRHELKEQLDAIKALPSIKAQFDEDNREEKKEEKKEETGTEGGTN